MKILIICHEFPPIGGGAGNAAYYLARHLTAKGHAVTVLTSRFGKNSRNSYDFKVEYLPVFRKHADRTSPFELISFAVSGILFGMSKIRRGQYDVSLAIHGIPGGWVAMFLYKVFRLPYVVSLRGGDVPGFLPESYDRLHKRINFLTRAYWNRAGALTANGSGLKDLASLVAKPLNKEVKVIANGVDCGFFKPDYSLRAAGPVRILYCGRITLQKGLGCFIKALNTAALSIKNPFEAVLIGDGDLRKALEKESEELVRSGKLRFEDWSGKETLLDSYRKSHIFILPSLYEGVSNSLLEAMACGLAVIASNIAGNREFVTDGSNGFLFAPGDDKRLGEILKQVLGRECLPELEAMGRRSRSAAEQLDWSGVADAYLEELNSAIEKR